MPESALLWSIEIEKRDIEGEKWSEAVKCGRMSGGQVVTVVGPQAPRWPGAGRISGRHRATLWLRSVQPQILV